MKEIRKIIDGKTYRIKELKQTQGYEEWTHSLLLGRKKIGSLWSYRDPHDDRKQIIQNIDLWLHYRNKGHGTNFHRMFEEYLKKERVEKIEVRDVEPDDKRTQHFLKKNGFRLISKNKHSKEYIYLKSLDC